MSRVCTVYDITMNIWVFANGHVYNSRRVFASRRSLFLVHMLESKLAQETVRQILWTVIRKYPSLGNLFNCKPIYRILWTYIETWYSADCWLSLNSIYCSHCKRMSRNERLTNRNTNEKTSIDFHFRETGDTWYARNPEKQPTIRNVPQLRLKPQSLVPMAVLYPIVSTPPLRQKWYQI